MYVNCNAGFQAGCLTRFRRVETQASETLARQPPQKAALQTALFYFRIIVNTISLIKMNYEAIE